MPTPAYAPPGLSVTSTGPSTPAPAAVSGKTVMFIGTAPKGPQIGLVDAGTAASVYGDPTSGINAGYTLPVALQLAGFQRQPTTNSPFRMLVMRVGGTAATAVMAATGGAWVTLTAAGSYYGTRGANLQLVYTLSSGVPTAISIVDTVLGVTLQSITAAQLPAGALSTPAGTAAAINGLNPFGNPNNVVTAVAGPGTTPVTAGPVTFTGGTDGAGAAYNDATVSPLLAQSLNYIADYIVPLFDLSSIYTASLGAHVSAAQAQNNWRKVIGGAAGGTTFSALSGAYNTFTSGRVQAVGHDYMNGFNPITGGFAQYDGFMLAAAHAGLIAVGPTHETADFYNLAGVSGVGNTGKVGPLSPADQISLGGSGFAWYDTPYGSSIPRLRDNVSSAPQYVNNALNYFQQFSVQSIDDSVSGTAYQAVLPYAGRPRGPKSASPGLIQSVVSSALGGLAAAGTINGGTPKCAYDQNGILQTQITYALPYPQMSLPITTGFAVSG